jgi:xanthine/uracil permease
LLCRTGWSRFFGLTAGLVECGEAVPARARDDSLVRRFWRAPAVLWTVIDPFRVGFLPLALPPMLITSWATMGKLAAATARMLKAATNTPRLRERVRGDDGLLSAWSGEIARSSTSASATAVGVSRRSF